MSYLSAVVNSNQTKCVGHVDELSDGSFLVEGKFLWALPYGLDLLANNYWGVRADQVFLAPETIRIKNRNSFSVQIQNKITKDTYQTNLFLRAGKIKNVKNLLELILKTIPENFQDLIEIIYDQNKEGGQLMVHKDCSLRLGLEIVQALGIKDQATFSGIDTYQYNEGTYRFYNKNHDLFKKNEGVVHLCMDVIQPSIFGNSQEAILCSLDPTKFGNSPPEVYHDLIQNPLRIVTFLFIDEFGDTVYFNPEHPSDFLFSIQLEFKNLSMS